MMSDSEQSKSIASIRDAIEARRPLIYLHSSEERRVERVLTEAARTCLTRPVPLLTWSVSEGLRQEGKPTKTQPAGPLELLDAILGWNESAVFLLKDFHEYPAASPEIRRRLRDIYFTCQDREVFVVLCSPVKRIPEEIQREVVLLTLPIPDVAELQDALAHEAPDLDAAVSYKLARALQGLTFNEAMHAIRRATSGGKKLSDESVDSLREEKRLMVRKAGLLEFVDRTVTIDEVGGLENLRNWLTDRRKLFHERESLSEEIVPKGVLLMGISGCGKSLSVKAIADIFDLPLYRVDLIRIFSGTVGNPEQAFADTCRMMEDIAPAVMWLDEIETAITWSGTESTGALGRIFGFFLTWMQEKDPGVFVAATANRIDLLPAEMIRKGRFDQVFFIDLPTPDERVDIFKIHLAKRGIGLDTLRVDRLARYTEGWTGAEIEQCVISALVSARIQDRPLKDDDLVLACREIVPISRTMKEQVNHIRSWAFDRAMRASPKQT